LVLLDGDAEALRHGVDLARERGLAGRVVAVTGSAQRIPLPDECVDAVVSRGSFCFWQDRAQGLREVKRVLRSGARARLGGGLGSRYPQWARREFIRKRLEAVAANGPGATHKFVEDRRPETFRRFALEAGMTSFEIISKDGLGQDEPFTGVGTWLQFAKEA
jgi:SAM-dependent methyltransferase